MRPDWRAAAGRLTHRLVLPRRLPAQFRRARLYVSSEGGLGYLRPRLSSVDPALLRLAGELVRPGAVVWDIGANLGLFSVAAAAMAGPAGRVLAVEPDCWLVSLLRRSATAGEGLAPVEVLPAAVSDRVGVGRFHIARRARATSHLAGFGTTQAGGVRASQLVPTVTMDWLLRHFPAPDLVKIDVEQAELPALAGASGVLAGRPALICEVAGANAAPVGELLGGFGYDFYDGTLPAGLRRPLDHVPWSLLALPGSGSGDDRSASTVSWNQA